MSSLLGLIRCRTNSKCRVKICLFCCFLLTNHIQHGVLVPIYVLYKFFMDFSPNKMFGKCIKILNICDASKLNKHEKLCV